MYMYLLKQAISAWTHSTCFLNSLHTLSTIHLPPSNNEMSNFCITCNISNNGYLSSYRRVVAFRNEECFVHHFNERKFIGICLQHSEQLNELYEQSKVIVTNFQITEPSENVGSSWEELSSCVFISICEAVIYSRKSTFYHGTESVHAKHRDRCMRFLCSQTLAR